MRQRVVTYGLGGFNPQQQNSNVVSDAVVTAPGLGADRLTVPPDGVTVVTCHYLARVPTETMANWTINGQAYSEPLVGGESTIEVTASVAGTLAITCNADSITIEVQ